MPFGEETFQRTFPFAAHYQFDPERQGSSNLPHVRCSGVTSISQVHPLGASRDSVC